MDTTALTTAWLGAVFNARSAAYQNFVQQVPQAKPSPADRTLSDTIESALQDAGAKPLQTINQVEPAAGTDAVSDPHINRLA
ncbi:MAG TPA: hypothetical protein VII40_08430 [Xanthobacteraceae bacterium]